MLGGTRILGVELKRTLFDWSYQCLIAPLIWINRIKTETEQLAQILADTTIMKNVIISFIIEV